MKEPVLTKADFVRRYAQGEFGNHSPTWANLKEWKKDKRKPVGLYHLRNRIPGGVTCYNVPMDEVEQRWNELGEKVTSLMYLSSMAPHEHNLIQGEVVQHERGLELLYSDVKDKPMRDALHERTLYAYGLKALNILKTTLCSNSYDWLQHLLDEYPHHVVEFSTFARNWGTLPRYNTVFWEVRLY